MELVETARRAKLSAAMSGENNPNYGKSISEETRAKMSEAQTGRVHSEETRAKMGAAQAGRVFSEEAKAKLSVAMTGRVLSERRRDEMSEAAVKLWEDPEYRAKQHAFKTGDTNPMKRPEVRAKFRGEKNPSKRPEVRAKISATKISKALTGKNSHMWKGGISFEPYCPLFNYAKKEEVRNRDGRYCQSCGKPEILEGRRLSVHHIDGDKMQGCGKRWGLVTLCRSCNSKPDTLEKEFLIVSNLQNQ